jgi:hypothetical protein
MTKQISITGLYLICLFLTTGWTDLFVNVGNQTSETISVSNSETGKEIRIRAAGFKRLLHGSGDLIVTTQSGAKFKFPDVAPFDVDEKYLKKSSSIFGPGWVTLNVMLGTNMQLYVLTRNKEAVIPQPNGYPKSAEKMVQ